jgi:hypothetical protein
VHRAIIGAVFDLIEERKRPEIKWWTLPTALCLIFLAGVELGILIERRRYTDPSDWVQVAFLLIVSFGTAIPVLRELRSGYVKPDRD